MSEAKDKKNLTKGVKNDSYLVGFISGACASCMSETVTIPLDTAKVRMMLYGMSGKYSSVTSTLKTIASEQGTRNLWKGTIPACQRQCVFSGIKLSLYDPIKNWSCSTPEELQELFLSFSFFMLRNIFIIPSKKSGIVSGARRYHISSK